jgi:hypothetical protein
MEEHQNYLEKAKKSLHVADHMLTMTYPLVSDPKLLVNVVDNLMQSLCLASYSVIYFERYNKNIPPFREDHDSRMNMFKLKCSGKLKYGHELVKLINQLQELLVENKESPISFSRKDKFVICSEEYKIKTLSVEEIKTLIAKAKLYIEEISTFVK